MTDCIPDHGTARNVCPVCGYRSDRATATRGNHTPSEGDLSICLNCGGVSQFGPGLTLARMTPEQIADLPARVLQEIARSERARRRVMGDLVRPTGRTRT